MLIINSKSRPKLIQVISVIQTLLTITLCLYLLPPQQIPKVAGQVLSNLQQQQQPNRNFQPQKLQQQQQQHQSIRRQAANQQQQQNAFYINPNPSTSSAGFRTGSLASIQPGDHIKIKPSSSFQVSSSSSSSIGKGEQSQLAEWPFYKSLQSARNTFNNNNQQQQPVVRNQPVKPAAEQHFKFQPPIEGESNRLTLAPTSSQADKLAKPELASGLMTETHSTDESAEKMIETTTNMELTSTTLPPVESTTPTAAPVVSTTTTPAPETTSSAPAMMQSLPISDPLFLPEFHTSLQKAVNRIVKMTAESMKNKQSMMSNEEPNEDESPRGRSSLSLNVLLKNFGVHNLTNLDQILLKSTLKNEPHSSHGMKPSLLSKKPTAALQETSGNVLNLKDSSKSDQKIEVNGVLETASLDNRTIQRGEVEMAECKIEYTMKHVNITLMNGGKSDYSCDYIIDRKLHQGNSSNSTSDGKKICKLQITSGFFSNNDSKERGCNSTHLVIGERRFCYLLRIRGDDSESTLNRVFDFPIERDDFDIKMVHKQRSDSEDQSESEIHLEIKPLSDGHCEPAGSSPTPAKPPAAAAAAGGGGVEYEIETSTQPAVAEQMMSSPLAISTSTTTPPVAISTSENSSPVQMSTAPRDPRQLASSATTVAQLSDSATRQLVAPSSPRRKFMLPKPTSSQEKISAATSNKRLKASSQSFDVENRKPEVGNLCDETTHDAAMGQLFTPEYPQYYRANMSCSFIIRRASSLFCHLSLHFRDFDLVNNNSSGRNPNDCSGDYLKIGTTRYCNKYAMIGHKMRVEFSQEKNNNSLELEFKSDHMQSGRGFLIKYSQIPCEQQQQSIEAVDERKSPMGDFTSQIKQRTIAPPLQQPDFGLALRTTNAPASLTKSSSDNQQQQKREKSLNKASEQSLNEADKQTSGRATEKMKVTQQQQQQATATSVMVPMASSVSSDALAPQLSAEPEDLQPAVAREDCNQVHSAMGFSLQSPGFPGAYDNNLQCLYYVRRNSSRVCYLELTFVKFDLEADADCRYDFLEINGVRLCGAIKDLAHKTTRIYLFNEPLKVIKFSSDNSATKGGFLIRADQLECGQNGSIMRQGKSSWDLEQPSGLGSKQPEVATSGSPALRSTVIHTNSTRTFEYDSSALSKWPAPRTRPQVISSLSSQRTSDVTSSVSSSSSSDASTQTAGRSGASGSSTTTTTSCDELLFGKEATIKSPLWPESYSNDESINSCRYTILRDTSSDTAAKNSKICQLELRFVNLRLGVSDCIDVDGYEVLCGFNTRNMVKYYPFDRQSHLTINFFTGASSAAAKVATGRSLLQSPDLLPARGPLRFMIIAKQHECIDDFLAPQADLATSYNQTNLLYATNSASINNNNNNRTSGSPAQAQNSANKPRGSQKSQDSLLRYDFSPSITSRSSLVSKQPVLMYSLLNPVNSSSSQVIASHKHLSQQPDPTLQVSNSKQFSPKDPRATPIGCLLDGSIIKREEQLFSANYPLGYAQQGSHCILTLTKKSEKTCALELEFLDLDFGDSPAARFCLFDYLEVNGERYCNMAQVERRLGPRRQLLIPFDRLVNDNKVELLFHAELRRPKSGGRGFLLRHREIECEASQSQDEPSTKQVVVEAPKPINRHVLSIARPESGSGSGSSQIDTADLAGAGCLIQFGQYNGIISSSNVLSKLRLTSGAHQSFNECQLKLRLLPGFCHLQLTFGEFELNSRLKNRCIGEWMELDGVQYCGDELKNSSRMISASGPSSNNQQRAVTIRFAGSVSSVAQFRAIFKQLECQPEPLRPLGQLPAPEAPAPAAVAAPKQVEPIERSQPEAVQFKEIVSKSEFFELNSAKLSRASGNTYDPNMFIVYRIKKTQPEVCKLRLMFYRFDLEPSLGCKRDFLDVNNVDRLCGQLSKPEDTRRDYDWPPGDRDFLVSFVSDSTIQREGYLLFGQQLLSNCSGSQSSTNLQPQMPTFDEDQPSTKSAPITTPMTTTTTTTQAPPSSTTETPTSSQMMMSQKDSGKSSMEDAANCYKLFFEQTFEISSPGWPQKYKPKTTCHYLIYRASPDICSVTLNVVSMILGPATGSDPLDPSSCDHKSSGSQDHLDFGSQVMLCGLLNRPKSIILDFDRSQFVTAKFSSNLGTGFGFFIEGKQNKCGSTPSSSQDQGQAAAPAEASEEKPASKQQAKASAKIEATSEGEQDTQVGCNRLLTDEVDIIESVGFSIGQNYPHNQDCLYALRRQNQSVCAIDLIMNHFDLEMPSNGSASCDNDYLEIDYSRFCGSYPAKHKFRFNYFQDELDKFIRFRSDSALSKSGFSITVTQVSDCNLSLPPTSTATTTTTKTPLEGNNDSEIISYLPDVASYSTVANNQSSQAQPEPAAKSSAGRQPAQSVSIGSSPQASSTLCQFVYHKTSQYLLSPNYNEHRRTYDNNIDCVYKIIARSYDYCSLRLTFVDLDLEQSSDCHNDYLLIDNQRYCGSVGGNGTSGKRSLEIQFAETLPREIHLLYHTSAHSNEGRGFKLLYEQQLCNPSPSSDSPESQQNFRSGNPNTNSNTAASSGLAEREARRQHFGQLSYPKDYVSAQQQQRLAASSKQHPRKEIWRDTRSSSQATDQQHQPIAMDLEEQHDDITLRKEIVVVKSAPTSVES